MYFVDKTIVNIINLWWKKEEELHYNGKKETFVFVFGLYTNNV